MLTVKQIEGLQPRGTQYGIADGEVRVLRIRVSLKGTKTFYLLYRFRGTKSRAKIGRFPEFGLADARVKGREILTASEHGKDPKAKR